MIIAKLLISCVLVTAIASLPSIAGEIYEPTQSYRGQVVFLGDSITDFWRQNGWQPWGQFYEPVGAVNTGVAGDRTTDVIRRINENGIIDNLNARLAVLMIGTNDLAWGGLNEEEIAFNIGLILNLIRSKNPGCRILLLGTFPRMESDIHQKIRNLNDLIINYANNQNVFFLNMESSFATGLGQIIPNLFSDGVHLTTDGYNTWASTMNPVFFELLDQEHLTGVPTTALPPTTTSGDRGEIVFIGDSITDFWRTDGKSTWDIHYGPMGAINTGVSGDLTSHTIQRINEGSIDNLQARLAVLLIGTNDLSWGVGDGEIIANIGTILNLIREKHPDVHILLLGILPRAPAETHTRAREVNKQIEKYASANDVTFLDMDDKFSHKAGYVYEELYTQDYLHLGPAGYVMWAVNINPIINEILKQ